MQFEYFLLNLMNVIIYTLNFSRLQKIKTTFAIQPHNLAKQNLR